MSLFSNLFATDDTPAYERFLNDENYRNRVLQTVLNNAQSQHDKKIRDAQREIETKKRIRRNRIESINNSARKGIGDNIYVNSYYGWLMYDHGQIFFDDMYALEPVTEKQTIHHYQTVTRTKKSPDWMGMGAAYINGDPIGALNAGINGKKTSVTNIEDHPENVIAATYIIVTLKNGNRIRINCKNPDRICKRISQAYHEYDPSNVVRPENTPEILQIDTEIKRLENELVNRWQKTPVEAYLSLPDIYKKPGYKYVFNGMQLKVSRLPQIEKKPQDTSSVPAHPSPDAAKAEEIKQSFEKFRQKYANPDNPQKINAYFNIWTDYCNGSAAAAGAIGGALYFGEDLRQSIDAFRFLLEAADHGNAWAQKFLERFLPRKRPAPSSKEASDAPAEK